MVLKRLVALMWCTLPEIHSSGLEPGRAGGGSDRRRDQVKV